MLFTAFPPVFGVFYSIAPKNAHVNNFKFLGNILKGIRLFKWYNAYDKTIGGISPAGDSMLIKEYVKDNPASANRPAYSILDNFMFRLTGDFRFADWHDAIEEYIRGL